MTLKITISEQALQGMVLAACEAYAFGKNDKRKPVEMYAHLWGYRRRQGSETEHVHVDRIGVCVSAKAKKDRVKVSTDVITLQDDIVKRWSPHVSLLGDFHTHPYKSLKKLRRVRGSEFSGTDIRSFRRYDDLWDRAGGPPIALVMAITKLKRVREGWARHPAAHRSRFDIGQYRFSIWAGAGWRDHKDRRKFGHKGVTLLLGQYFHNRASSRVGQD